MIEQNNIEQWSNGPERICNSKYLNQTRINKFLRIDSNRRIKHRGYLDITKQKENTRILVLNTNGFQSEIKEKTT